MEKREKLFTDWIKDHKNGLILGSLVITSFSVFVLAVASKKTMPIKYSAEWMRSLSLSGLEKEREIVRRQFCSAGNTQEGCRLQKQLWLFDRIIREKHNSCSCGIYPYPREHGWNLYKPD